MKSEDGAVDVSPGLRPRVQRSDIRAGLVGLRRAAGVTPADPDGLRAAIGWLEGTSSTRPPPSAMRRTGCLQKRKRV